MTEEKITTKKKLKQVQTEKSDVAMSFLEHLEQLRWHLVRIFIAVFVLGIVAFIFKEFIFDEILLGPREDDFVTNVFFCKMGKILGIDSMCINTGMFELININMAGQFSTHIKVSLVAGFVVAFPYIFWEFWTFISPALYNTERKHTTNAVFWSSFLFIFGVAFGYFVIAPLTIQFFGGYLVSDVVGNQINLVSYVSMMSSVLISGGVVFELPILIYFLSKAGIVTPDFLKKYRKHSIIIILTISAIITPPDIFSQILVGLPLMFLYEVGIFLSKRVVKQKKIEADKLLTEVKS